MLAHCNDANYCSCGDDNEGSLLGTIGSHDADNEGQDDEQNRTYYVSDDR